MSSTVGGLFAGLPVNQLWQCASPGERSQPPGALEISYPFTETVPAAAVEGTIYAAVKTVIERTSGRMFQRWPGSGRAADKAPTS